MALCCPCVSLYLTLKSQLLSSSNVVLIVALGFSSTVVLIVALVFISTSYRGSRLQYYRPQNGLFMGNTDVVRLTNVY